MKACQKCRCIHADDYMGTCTDCGAPMGSQTSGGGDSQQDLSFRYARQNAKAISETAAENRMKRGNYDGVSLEASILEVAKGFVTVDRDRYIKAGGDPDDLQ